MNPKKSSLRDIQIVGTLYTSSHNGLSNLQIVSYYLPQTVLDATFYHLACNTLYFGYF